MTCGEGYAALNLMRQRDFDAVFLGLPPRARDGQLLIEHLRSFDRNTTLVVIAPEKVAKEIGGDKAKLNISSVIQSPVDVHDFFRLLARMRERRKSQEAEQQSQRPVHPSSNKMR